MAAYRRRIEPPANKSTALKKSYYCSISQHRHCGSAKVWCECPCHKKEQAKKEEKED